VAHPFHILTVEWVETIDLNPARFAAKPHSPLRRIAILSTMHATRPATPADAQLLTAHRHAMFTEMGKASEDALATMSLHFAPWVRRMLSEGKYLGWIVESDDQPVASAGLFLLEWPPHPLDPANDHRGYLLNMYVDPAHRRQGLAKRLVQLCLDETRRRGLRVAALHASDSGRPLYESFNFTPTNEMFFIHPPGQ
jgi:ribosomal protein S18 acetylase RimI-like enzyme